VGSRFQPPVEGAALRAVHVGLCWAQPDSSRLTRLLGPRPAFL
jgi:hypothetical protein